MKQTDLGFAEGVLVGRLKAKSLPKEKQRTKVFDWSKAEKILAEHGWPYAEAGLAEDWPYTSGVIVRDKKKVNENDNMYLASFWATPCLKISEDEDLIECWIYQEDTKWGAGTVWPDLSTTHRIEI